MKASVIICTYNRAKSLARTLDSLKRMEVPRDLSWELVVVDNNSKDDTADVVGKFRATTPIHIQYVVETKQGLSFARNRGIRVKKGEITAFTDDDVIVDKFWLSEIVNAFEKYDAACVGGKILPLWEYPPPKWLRKELYCYIALLDSGEDVLRLELPHLWGANFAVKSSLFEKYGAFDTGLGRLPHKLYGYEETELLAQLIQAREKVFYCPGVVVHHCIPADRMKKSYFRKWKFDEGEHMAIRSRDGESRRFFGVPLNSIEHLIRTVLHYFRILVFKPEEAFLDELKIVFDLSYIRAAIRHRTIR